MFRVVTLSKTGMAAPVLSLNSRWPRTKVLSVRKRIMNVGLKIGLTA